MGAGEGTILHAGNEMRKASAARNQNKYKTYIGLLLNSTRKIAKALETNHETQKPKNFSPYPLKQPLR